MIFKLVSFFTFITNNNCALVIIMQKLVKYKKN